MAVRFDLVDGVIVYAQKGAPAHDEWERYIRFLRQHFPQMDRPRVLVVADAGPSPTQRSALESVLRTRASEVRISMVTSNSAGRGTVASMRLLFPTFRAFEPSDVSAALAFLEIPRDRYDLVIAQANIACNEVGIALLPRASDALRGTAFGRGMGR